MNQPPKSPSLEERIAAIPPLPATVSRVLQVTADPESSANDLMKAILPDQSMCLAVLKIANSVIYGRPKQAASLEDAIVVLGFNEIRNIVISKAASQTINRLLGKYGQVLHNFWEHGFACGIAARVISDHLAIPSGLFFTAGLFHDIGKLAMLVALGDRYSHDKWLNHFSTAELLTAEKEQFQTSHGQLGARLLQRWQFPDKLVVALAYHHQPGAAQNISSHALVIQLADFLAHQARLPNAPNEAQLKEQFSHNLPGFVDLWRQRRLPWEDTSLESWFRWTRVDLAHGSAILDILAR